MRSTRPEHAAEPAAPRKLSTDAPAAFPTGLLFGLSAASTVVYFLFSHGVQNELAWCLETFRRLWH